MKSSNRTYGLTWNMHNEMEAMGLCEGILNYWEETEKMDTMFIQSSNTIVAFLSLLSWCLNVHLSATKCCVFFQQTNGVHLGKSCSYLWVRPKHAGAVACVNTAVRLNTATSHRLCPDAVSILKSREVPFSKSGAQGSDGGNWWVIHL